MAKGRTSRIAALLRILIGLTVFAITASASWSYVASLGSDEVSVPEANHGDFASAKEDVLVIQTGMVELADELRSMRLQSEAPAISDVSERIDAWKSAAIELGEFFAANDAVAALSVTRQAEATIISVGKTLASDFWQPRLLDGSAATLLESASSLSFLVEETDRLEIVERGVAGRTLESASRLAVLRIGTVVMTLAALAVAASSALLMVSAGIGGIIQTRTGIRAGSRTRPSRVLPPTDRSGSTEPVWSNDLLRSSSPV